jgi:hypothetical protein
VELEAGGLEDGGVVGVVEVLPPVEGLTPVVVSAVVMPGDLQADASETDAIAVPAVTIAALLRNCLLEYLVTRKMAFLP